MHESFVAVEMALNKGLNTASFLFVYDILFSKTLIHTAVLTPRDAS